MSVHEVFDDSVFLFAFVLLDYVVVLPLGDNLLSVSIGTAEVAILFVVHPESNQFRLVRAVKIEKLSNAENNLLVNCANASHRSLVK